MESLWDCVAKQNNVYCARHEGSSTVIYPKAGNHRLSFLYLSLPFLSFTEATSGSPFTFTSHHRQLLQAKRISNVSFQKIIRNRLIAILLKVWTATSLWLLCPWGLDETKRELPQIYTENIGWKRDPRIRSGNQSSRFRFRIHHFFPDFFPLTGFSREWGWRSGNIWYGVSVRIFPFLLS